MRMQLKDMKGATVVEFALVLPLLLILVFGIIEFGFLLYNQAMITNAAREGARYGITISPSKTDTQIKAVASDYCEKYLVKFSGSSTPPEINVKDKDGDSLNPATAGLVSVEDSVTVEINWDYEFLVLPSLITDLGFKKNLFASATMRAE